MAPKKTPPLERCWKFIERDEITSCWLWTGDLHNAGYGSIWEGKKVLYAYKVIWEYIFGKTPEGKQLHHRCEEKRCVNPFHLECLTVLEHQIRHGNTPVSKNRLKTHCNKGHPLSGDNLFIEKNGGRRCNECRRIKMREWYATHHKEEYDKYRDRNLAHLRDKYHSNSEYRERRKAKSREEYYRKKNTPIPPLKGL